MRAYVKYIFAIFCSGSQSTVLPALRLLVEETGNGGLDADVVLCGWGEGAKVDDDLRPKVVG